MRRIFPVARSLGRFARNARIAASLARDYWKGSYRETPWYIIASILAALIYVLDPLDLIPDVLPVIGLVDDALVTALCLALAEKDLHRYALWKENRS